MKTGYSLLLLLFYSMLFCQIKEDNIAGMWYSEENEKSTIKIYKAGDGYYYGKIVSSAKPEYKSKVVVEKLIYDEVKKVFTGSLTVPSNGINVNVTISFENRDKIKLVGKKLLLRKVFYWERS